MTETSVPLIEPVVLRARQQLREGRVKIRQRHDQGANGYQVCTQVTDLFDRVVLDIWNDAISSRGLGKLASRVALIAHGGYGRCDLAPFSDVDLMLVPARGIAGEIQPLASVLSRNIVDAGLQLGFSVRRPDEACRLAWKDPVIYSSLTESRFLAGSVQVYVEFFQFAPAGSAPSTEPIGRCGPGGAA